MTNRLKNTLLAAAAGAISFASGCATNAVTQEQLGEVRMVADEAMRTANTADYNAQQAKSMADEALTNMRMMMKSPMMMKMMSDSGMMMKDGMMMKKGMMKSMMK